MKIYVSADQDFPATDHGSGSERMMDNIVKGLSELGHDIFHHIKRKVNAAAFPGVTFVSEMPKDIDIAIFQDLPKLSEPFQSEYPWLKTHHGPHGAHYLHPDLMDHLVFVSRSHAQFHGSNRFVYNGIDPSEFIYSETKEDYVLFVVSHLERAKDKGFEIALSLVKQKGIRLVVAGGIRSKETLDYYQPIFKKYGIEYLGKISNTKKAEVFAGAKAVLFPTQLKEAFGLVMVEALVSGTPVICSDMGACPEVVSPDTGFVCQTISDYENALDNLGRIAPEDCRTRVLKHFHYREMAKNYVLEYKRQIERQFQQRIKYG